MYDLFGFMNSLKEKKEIFVFFNKDNISKIDITSKNVDSIEDLINHDDIPQDSDGIFSIFLGCNPPSLLNQEFTQDCLVNTLEEENCLKLCSKDTKALFDSIKSIYQVISKSSRDTVIESLNLSSYSLNHSSDQLYSLRIMEDEDVIKTQTFSSYSKLHLYVLKQIAQLNYIKEFCIYYNGENMSIENLDRSQIQKDHTLDYRLVYKPNLMLSSQIKYYRNVINTEQRISFKEKFKQGGFYFDETDICIIGPKGIGKTYTGHLLAFSSKENDGFNKKHLSGYKQVIKRYCY